MIKRRSLITLAASTPWLLTLPAGLMASQAGADNLKKAMAESSLIYLTPIQSNGQESRCQSEVWFTYDGDDLYVCTTVKTWRARAVARGLDRARIWVGDLGEWKGTGGKYRALPQIEAQVSVVSDKGQERQALEMFGDKYSLQWVLWGPRFRKGLADGSRIMLRYRPLIAQGNPGQG